MEHLTPDRQLMTHRQWGIVFLVDVVLAAILTAAVLIAFKSEWGNVGWLSPAAALYKWARTR